MSRPTNNRVTMLPPKTVLNHQTPRPEHFAILHPTGYAHQKSDNIECKSMIEMILSVSDHNYPQCASPLHCCC
jgi:hypothetical protein